MLAVLVKQPGELIASLLPFAAPVATVDSITAEPRGLVPGAAALTGTGAIVAGAGVNVRLVGGSDGERYLVTVRVTCADGEQLEGELDVAVIEATWALPDGGTPWLTIADFVKKVGYAEVVKMTDETGAGRIDRDMLIGALADAQATAESYIAGRYALPLAEVPRILSMAVSNLAAASLYPRGAPDGIKAAAASALNLLGRLQSGSASLPIAGLAPPMASDAPVVVSPGRRAYPDNLAGYVDDPRWPG